MDKIFKHLASLTAPQYLLLTIFLPISAYMLINSKLPGTEILPIILSLSIAVAGFNATNMVFDEELDRLNKPRRPIPAGELPKDTVKKLGISLYVIAILVALIFSPLLSALIIAFALVSYAYSAPPFRLRNYLWGSAITGAILYGAIPFFAVQLISTPIPSSPIFLLFFVSLFLAISNTKDFEDVSGERKLGIKSIATELGAKLGAAIVIISEFGIVTMMSVLALTGAIETKFIYAAGFSFLIMVPANLLFWKSVSQLEAKNAIIEKIHAEELKDTIFQAEGVTISIMLVIMIPLIFGLIALVKI